MKTLSLLLSLFILTACGASGPAPDSFVLRTDEAAYSTITPAKHPLSGTLKIILPAAAPALDSTNIAVLQEGGKMSFIAGRAWAEPLPKLVQAQLLEGFEQAGLFSSTVPDSQGIASRYSLMTDIRNFTLEQTKDGSKVHVRMVARLVNPISHAIIASAKASHTVQLESGVSHASVTEAFNTASLSVTAELVEKLRRKLR